MTETVISLDTNMQRRLEFDHPLMPAGVELPQLGVKDAEALLERYIAGRSLADRDEIFNCYLWVVKDFVCRFRAHWPIVQSMTDDLVSVGVEALLEFLREKENPEKDLLLECSSEGDFFNKISQFIHNRMRDYINYNRSSFSASTRTNRYREKAGESTEYNFAAELNEELSGMEVNDPLIVDILDTIEAMNDIDAEEMRDLVLGFLEQNHNISEEQLTDDERRSLEKLTELVRNAGL